MPTIKLPTRASSILIGYFSLMAIGLAIVLLGLSMHTSASMISAAMLGAYVALYCPQVWTHVVGYRSQVYRSEWLFMAVTLSPMPVWLYTMFFAQIDSDHAIILVLPAVTLFLGYLLPSEEHTGERVPVWQMQKRTG